MKNFKKVISAVIALAISASTLVAVSAAKFTDVDDTNNYVEAINVLTALDVVHGYEDGSFKPDGEITRAEAATMIVGALNMTADAQAAAGTSKFTDVNEQASWASGYVNVGVAQGFINGMDDTTFAPQQNVTYAQMCVMLTIITGYGDYAAANGGWPTGYTKMAANVGITKGVNLSNDTPLKRGQVAQMLYNAVTAPVLEVVAYKFDGDTYAKLDGTNGNQYKTLLSDKFDGYEVRATVDDLADAGKVNLTNITSDYTKASKGSDYIPTIGGVKKINGAIIENDIDLSGLLKQEVRAILALDTNNKRHLLYAETTDNVETLEVVADDFETVDYAANQKIKFGSSKYTFENSVKVYVNGYLYGTYTTTTAGVNATLAGILEKAAGEVKFAKTAANATNYDTIFVDVYTVGQVTNVSYKNEETVVKFNVANAGNLDSYKSIKITDNELATGVTKVSVEYNGQEIALKDIQVDDIIAVKTKIIGGNNEINASNNTDVKVLVSRETISGRVTAIDNGVGENSFTIDSTEYAAVDKGAFAVGLNVGDVYNTIYLDPLGRLYSYNEETVEDSKNYAILAKVADKTDLTLVLPDGTKKTYEAKDANIFLGFAANALEISGTAPTINATGPVLLATSVDPQDCVVEYSLKKGQINEIKRVTGTSTPFAAAEYKASVNKVGTVGIIGTTQVIKATDGADYKKYTAFATDSFIDGEKYTGVGYGKITGTSNYAFVVLTVTGYTYGENARFAVVNAGSFSKGTDEDGDSVDQLKVLFNGEKTVLNFTAAAKTAFGAVNYGDVFFYTVDDGLVDTTCKIARGTIGGALPTFNALFGAGEYDNTKWTQALTTTGNQNIQLISGTLVSASASKVGIIVTPTVADGPVDTDNYESFSLASDCKVYTYADDAEVADKDKLDAEGVLTASDFKAWRIVDTPTQAGYTAADIGKTVWGYTIVAGGPAPVVARGMKASYYDQLEVGETADTYAQKVLALVVDSQVVEIYQIIK